MWSAFCLMELYNTDLGSSGSLSPLFTKDSLLTLYPELDANA